MQIQHEHFHYHVEMTNFDFILPIVCEVIQFKFINIQINQVSSFNYKGFF